VCAWARKTFSVGEKMPQVSTTYPPAASRANPLSNSSGVKMACSIASQAAMIRASVASPPVLAYTMASSSHASDR
jgi:hypothetical protein